MKLKQDEFVNTIISTGHSLSVALGTVLDDM